MWNSIRVFSGWEIDSQTFFANEIRPQHSSFGLNFVKSFNWVLSILSQTFFCKEAIWGQETLTGQKRNYFSFQESPGKNEERKHLRSSEEIAKKKKNWKRMDGKWRGRWKLYETSRTGRLLINHLALDSSGCFYS